jgi:hypothetical protein
MSTGNEVVEAVDYYHSLLAAAWTDNTAHHQFRPLPDGMAPSYGQCIPSSIVLLRELRRDFPNEDMQLAPGRVLTIVAEIGGVALRPIIRNHTWLHWLRGSGLHEISVIDPTADQAADNSLPPYVVATYDELLDWGIIYQPRRVYDNLTELIAHLAIREPTIEGRVQLLQTRFDEQKRLAANEGLSPK